MLQSPFVSETFIKIWSKHFNQSKAAISFDFIKNILFVKHSFLPYYINVGENLTNGIPYVLSENDEDDYKGKVFLIRDMPTYFDIDESLTKASSLKLCKSFQYEGFTTKIADFKSLEDYLLTIFKSNTRSKFRRNITRLEACFTVSYDMHYGNISKDTFDAVFKEFYKLFEKRYAEKQEPCGELNPKLWNYYTDLAYQMINEGTASLFVISADGKPIGITFSYHFGSTLIEALTVFDIDFYRYNIGHTMILKMLEWSFQNGVKLFDYTQGDFDYKRRWSSSSYKTHYHILYDSKSPKSILTAKALVVYFDLKRWFREKQFNKTYHKLKHRIFKTNNLQIVLENYNVDIVDKSSINRESLKTIDFNLNAYLAKRRAFYDFLYMSPEPLSGFKILEDSSGKIYAISNNQALKISRNVQ